MGLLRHYVIKLPKKTKILEFNRYGGLLEEFLLRTPLRKRVLTATKAGTKEGDLFPRRDFLTYHLADNLRGCLVGSLRAD
jgi:hypothetical protein